MRIAQLTRNIARHVIQLHGAALVRDCRNLDALAARAVRVADDQKSVVAWAQRELTARRREADEAADAADAAWHAATKELASLPRF